MFKCFSYCVCLYALLTLYVYMLHLLCMSLCFTYCVCLHTYCVCLYAWGCLVQAPWVVYMLHLLYLSICFTYCVCLYTYCECLYAWGCLVLAPWARSGGWRSRCCRASTTRWSGGPQMCSAGTWRGCKNIYIHIYIQSWARDNILALRQRQRVNGIEFHGQKKFEKCYVPVSRWSSHNEYSAIMQ